MTKPKPNMLEKLIAVVAALGDQVGTVCLAHRRLRMIEDRLAALDGGDNADRSIRAAVTAEAAAKLQRGEPGLGFTFKDQRGSAIVCERSRKVIEL